MSRQKSCLLFVGAFPSPTKKVYGGNITDCKTLLDAGLNQSFHLILLDSTQRSVPPPSFWRRMIDSLSRSGKYLRLVVRHHPDAILIFASSGFSFLEKSLFAVFGHFLSSRVLFFPRGGRLMDLSHQNSLYRLFVKFMMKFPDVLLCQGEVWRNFFINEINIPEEKCIILTNWTATPSLLKLGNRRNYYEKENHRILFLGWIYRSKGIFELIDALAMIHPLFPNVELFVAGEGEDSDEARKYIVKKDLKSSVHFLGWIHKERKLKVLSDTTIFCLPSHVEGLPNAMIEAMAAGLPVVVTPVGSIPNVISDRENGMIVPVQDSHSLALTLRELIENAALRERIGRNAYKSAKNDFCAGQAVIKLANLVANLKRQES